MACSSWKFITKQIALSNANVFVFENEKSVTWRTLVPKGSCVYICSIYYLVANTHSCTWNLWLLFFQPLLMNCISLELHTEAHVNIGILRILTIRWSWEQLVFYKIYGRIAVDSSQINTNWGTMSCWHGVYLLVSKILSLDVWEISPVFLLFSETSMTDNLLRVSAEGECLLFGNVR